MSIPRLAGVFCPIRHEVRKGADRASAMSPGARRTRWVIMFGFAVLLVPPLFAQTGVQQTPGTIARFGLPAGFQHQYNEAADSLILLEPERHQLVLFVWAPGDTDEAVAALLSELGAQDYRRNIQPVTIAGLRGSEVRIDVGGGAKDRIIALPFGGMLLGIWGKTAGGFSDLDAPIATVIGSLSLAEATRPAIVVGTYQTSSMQSTDWSGDGIFRQEYVTLYANGAAEQSSNTGGQVGDVSLSGSGSTTGARWEVRGNRLLVFGEDYFLNYGLRAFNNGLELYDQDGSQYLWVRQ